MSRLAGWWAHGVQSVRCALQFHHYVLSVDPVGDPLLAQRCLYCGAVTTGWVLEAPRYRQTYPGDRARLVLHNPRLKRCPCAACDARRRDRRQRVVKMRTGTHG